MPDALSSEAVQQLLDSSGLEGPWEVVPMVGGSNNRAYLITLPSGRYVLKSYYTPSQGGRDRLAAEYGFAYYAWQAGVRALPKPLARHDQARLTLYGFIEGRKLRKDEVRWPHQIGRASCGEGGGRAGGGVA